jgi:hypothetical protein
VSHELTPDQFFAAAVGVCVYVVVGDSTVRVEFESPDAEGVARGTSLRHAKTAVLRARCALHKHRAELAGLFEHIAAECGQRAKRLPKGA